jgi:hypothetical protein
VWTTKTNERKVAPFKIALKETKLALWTSILLELLGLIIANELVHYRVCPNFVLFPRALLCRYDATSKKHNETKIMFIQERAKASLLAYLIAFEKRGETLEDNIAWSFLAQICMAILSMQKYKRAVYIMQGILAVAALINNSVFRYIMIYTSATS